MSSSDSAINDGDGARQDSPAQADETLLRIDVAAEEKHFSHSKLAIEPLAGHLPRDDPIWTNHAEMDDDARGLLPHTLRYACIKEPSYMIPVAEHEEIRRAIWRKLDPLLEAGEDQLSIVFDQLSANTDSSYGVLDLVFQSHDSLEAVEGRLKELEIKHSDGTISKYEHESSTNSLSGDVLVLECLRLPLDVIDPQELFEALTAVAAPVGTVLGIGQLVTKARRYGVKRSPTGVTRCYIKIHRANMALLWDQLVRRLATHLRWQGYPYTLNFPGRQHHERDLLSADYPLIQSQGNDESGKRTDGASNSKRARQSKEGPDASKKRKAPSDQ